jgi:hypothetical protein
LVTRHLRQPGTVAGAAQDRVDPIGGEWLATSRSRTTWVEYRQGTEIEPTEVTPSLAELVSGLWVPETQSWLVRLQFGTR